MRVENAHIRQATSVEIQEVLTWCQQEGWSVKPEDEALYSIVDSKGFFLLVGTRDGKEVKVGAIAFVKLDFNLSWIGCFVVKPEYRRERYGEDLWKFAMLRAPTQTASLYAVPSMQRYYTGSGFNSAFQVQRWKTLMPRFSTITSEDCVAVSEAQIPSIVAYGSSIFTGYHADFWLALFTKSQVSGLILQESGKVVGMGVVRPCTDGYRIGPLYADSAEAAQKLLNGLLNKIDSTETIILDSPAENRFCSHLMESQGLTRVTDQDTVAMFKGEEPTELLNNLNRNYGIFSLDIG